MHVKKRKRKEKDATELRRSMLRAFEPNADGDRLPAKLTLHNLVGSKSHCCSLSHVWDLESTQISHFMAHHCARVPTFLPVWAGLVVLIG